MKKKLLALCIMLSSFQMQANANNCFCEDFTVGADFLYWSPCFSDNHYALVYKNENHIDYKYIDCDWEPGVRVFAALKGFCGFDVGVAYTYINASQDASVKGHGDYTVALSNGDPYGSSFHYDDDLFYSYGDKASCKWDFTYQTIEGVVALPFTVDNGCFKLDAYTGVQGLFFTQERKEHLGGIYQGGNLHWKRNQDYWGVGPEIGVRYSYNAFRCFDFFGNINVSLSIGQNELKDREHIGGGEVEFDYHYKFKDECVCFPGIHWTSGISFNTCLCGTELTFAAGYEYVNWFNVPQFHNYQEENFGILASARHDDIVLQGFFLRAAASF